MSSEFFLKLAKVKLAWQSGQTREICLHQLHMIKTLLCVESLTFRCPLTPAVDIDLV